jgi:hypothetical protein
MAEVAELTKTLPTQRPAEPGAVLKRRAAVLPGC